MNSDTVDLVATDPPFNKGRDFHATPDSLASGASFQDRWSWDRDVHQEWVDQITDAQKLAVQKLMRIAIAPTGFEPVSTASEATVLDHYTTGLFFVQ